MWKFWEKAREFRNMKKKTNSQNKIRVMTRFRRRRRRGSSLLWIRWPWRFGSFCCWPTSSSRSPCGWWPASRLTSGTTMWTAAGWAAGVTTATTTCRAALAAASTRSCNSSSRTTTTTTTTNSITMPCLAAISRCWPAATISRWPTVSGLPLALWCSKDPISIPRYFVVLRRWPSDLERGLRFGHNFKNFNQARDFFYRNQQNEKLLRACSRLFWFLFFVWAAGFYFNFVCVFHLFFFFFSTRLVSSLHSYESHQSELRSGGRFDAITRRSNYKSTSISNQEDVIRIWKSSTSFPPPLQKMQSRNRIVANSSKYR